MTTGAPADSRDLGHVGGLDGLRGIAILLVVTTHGVLAFWVTKTTSVFAGGFLGVELFFVLSGFLITSLLIGEHARSGRISFRKFYLRRALRLLPALVMFLAVHAVYVVVTRGDTRTEFRSLLPVLFYFANWWEIGHPFAFELGHLWSLSVEEQFYVVWPLLIAGLLAWRWSRRYAIGIMLVAIGLLTFSTTLQWKTGTNLLNVTRIYVRTDNQAVCLLAGAAAAFVWRRYRLPARTLTVLAWISATFIGACAWSLNTTRVFYWKGGLTLIGLAAAIVTLAVVNGTFGRALTWTPLRAIGRVSYGLYLWHLPIFLEVHRHVAWPAIDQAVFAVALTATVTCASWFVVETPFLRWKSRLAANRSARDRRRLPVDRGTGVSSPSQEGRA